MYALSAFAASISFSVIILLALICDKYVKCATTAKSSEESPAIINVSNYYALLSTLQEERF